MPGQEKGHVLTSGSFNWNTRIANFKFPSCGVPQKARGAVDIANFIFCDPNTGSCDTGSITITVNTTTRVENYDGLGVNGLADPQHLAQAFANDFNFSGSPSQPAPPRAASAALFCSSCDCRSRRLCCF